MALGQTPSPMEQQQDGLTDLSASLGNHEIHERHEKAEMRLVLQMPQQTSVWN